MSRSILPPLGVWFSAHGRLCRKQYFFSAVVLMLPGLAAMTPLLLIYHGVINATSEAGLAVLLLSLGFLTFWGYATFCLHAKRLHDLGLPAVIATVFIVAIPFELITVVLLYFHLADSWLTVVATGVGAVTRDANVGAGAYLMLAPGEKHDNQYGADPLEQAAF